MGEVPYDPTNPGTGPAFQFLDDSHRCSGYIDCGPIVGRGWFKHLPNDDFISGTNDWLFQARLIDVPEPGIMLLMASGLIGIGVARRKRH